MDRDSAADARVARMLADRGQEMSDCSTNAWLSPSGREIHVHDGMEPHELELTYPDDTRRYLHYAGDLPVTVRIDGVEYARACDGL